jgi:hypothetical protein
LQAATCALHGSRQALRSVAGPIQTEGMVYRVAIQQFRHNRLKTYYLKVDAVLPLQNVLEQLAAKKLQHVRFSRPRATVQDPTKWF